MTITKLWEPGQVVVVREVLKGKIYSAVAMRVVQDAPDFSVLYLAPQTPYLWPHTSAGESIRIQTEHWVLREEPWPFGDTLYLIQPGSGYTVTAVWNEVIFDFWKINLEEPMRRTELGFDYMDQMLDIIVTPDRSSWRWKDEDEIQLALERGILSKEQARGLYQLGESAVQKLQSKQPPFDKDWDKWKPELSWRASLHLPKGWDRL